MPFFVDVVFNLPVQQSFTYSCPEAILNTTDYKAMGYRVVAPVGKRTLTGFVVNVSERSPEGLSIEKIKEIKRRIDDVPLFDEHYLELAKWLADMYLCSLGEALSAMLPGGRRESEMPALGVEEESFEKRSITLSGEQIQAIKTISEGNNRFYYLYGITGSGKTEVFLRAAKTTLDQGKSVIYLVPEISLTHQVVDAIKQRFKNESAVLHSRLTPSQKLTEWKRILSGEAHLVVGARSAVFAPLKNLGLIILDEEHEGTYKSSATPRYHARQVAMKRCHLEKACFVMGSATPSVEAHYLMGKEVIKRITLSKRLSGGRMPAVSIVDLNVHTVPFSEPLIEEIKKTHKQGRQTILFLNRRGFSYFFHCRSCGFQMKCRRCSVNLTFHKAKNLMVCHYCGYKTRPRTICPECNSLDVGYSGFGTERIEEEINHLFPDFSVRRIDTDSVRKKGKLETILSDFRDGDVDILLGTQMVAKGLNFPGVKLVGIILADTGLHLPDFRAAERTFSLVVQVSGRAGRFMPDGKVIIQSYTPGNLAIQSASAHDLKGFYEAELEIRKHLGFPPYSRLFRFVFRSKDRDKAEKAAEEFSAGIESLLPDDSDLLGPADCPIAVISGNSRMQLLIRTQKFGEMHRIVSDAIRMFVPPSSVYVEIDIDPVSLL